MNCFVLLYIALPSATAATIEAKLSSAKTISEALWNSEEGEKNRLNTEEHRDKKP
jgi:hypothetical protein